VGENGLHGGNVEIMDIIETYNLFVTVYIVTEGQIIQPLTITVDRIVAERNVYPDCLSVSVVNCIATTVMPCCQLMSGKLDNFDENNVS
jgi:hypothetical protein